MLTESDERTIARTERGSFGMYRIEMQHNLLSHEDEMRLGQRSIQGDTDARNELVRHNLRLVVSVAHVFRRARVPFEELVQEGNIGLIHAASKFDPSRGVRFATYAMWWIKSSIFGALNKSSLVSIPESVFCDIRKIQRAEYRLMMKQEEDVTDARIATETNLAVDRVRLLRGGVPIDSMDSSFSNENEQTLHDTIEDSRTENDVAVVVERDDFIKKILTLFDDERVPKKKRAHACEVFERAYGLNGRETQTIPEIATSMGISNPRVKSLLSMAHRVVKNFGGEFF